MVCMYWASKRRGWLHGDDGLQGVTEKLAVGKRRVVGGTGSQVGTSWTEVSSLTDAHAQEYA